MDFSQKFKISIFWGPSVSGFDNRGTYTHICVYDYTQMPSQLHTIACSSLGANSYLKQFLLKLLMLKSQA